MQIPKYENKPFRPPRRIGSSKNAELKSTTSTVTTAPIPKAEVTTNLKRNISAGTPLNVAKKPNNLASNEAIRYFTIMYRKPTTKKHKTWSGDGYATLKVNSSKLGFYNEAGKLLGSSTLPSDSASLFETLFKAGSNEVQLDYELKESTEINSAKRALSQAVGNTSSITTSATVTVPSTKNDGGKYQMPLSQLFTLNTVKKFKSVTKQPSEHMTTLTKNNQNSQARKYYPVFDVSKIDNPLIMNKNAAAEVDVIVDPLLGKFLRPHQREGVKFMYDCVMGLARPRIENQNIDCTTKSLVLENDSDISGCLLADDMGLGKTLMSITLIWTLIRQTPFASKVPCSQSGIPLSGLCKKILIVCPVTLIGNWKREFGKWLNLSRIGILTLSSRNSPDMDKMAVRNFLKVQRTYQVLIIGYEKLLSVSEELEKNKQLIDLLVCDEGHRLKNGTSKILNTLKNLDIRKKLLLTGTPIQNDLNEFFTIIDFINPGILGSFGSFKRRFIIPITRARDTANRYNEELLEKGEEKSKEMIEITKRFILRRTNAILEKYLPPKTDIILFCKPYSQQILAFKDILQGARLDFGQLTFSSSLGLITLLKKVCNSPGLVGSDPYYKSHIKDAQSQGSYSRSLNSGKLKVLMTLLEGIRKNTEEKVVVVSNYTQTLDIIENLMNMAGMSHCRLDGSIPAKQRDSIVTSFNRNPAIFGFLLSAKSGGVGLNLVGASRLILFDNDWNPSVDLQAMSRIHRDGQKKPCFIYRLVTTGCIDEKILQRQLMKNSLSQKFLGDSEMKNKGSSNDDLFNKEDLKDLFSVHTDTKSNTHDLICSCEGLGEEIEYPETNQHQNAVELKKSGIATWTSALELQKEMNEAATNEDAKKSQSIRQCLVHYKHIDPARQDELFDEVITESFSALKDNITFAFVKPSEICLKEQ
ncbi:Rdh54p [Saccharomyces cerevisiae YJM1078]|nr:Rdh54p [Saccharomyces cerevisiae YJM1078]AJQ00847.1 Rdh54p [Saccharomyces cerevisiae YJM248]CAI4261337.1 AIE_G0002690.mRNA.1.CDS.1 [Saccharomyces cerevisiae]CAI6490857.1 AIE_G0002690.mRNA.1.CDS.1 [Saccharomyces cerevisiae]